MKTLIISIWTGLGCFWAAQVCAEETNSARIVDYGIYKGSGESSINVSNSPSGNVLLGGKVKLVKQTDRIPAVLGTKFGFHCELSEDMKKKKLKIVYLFPDIKNPQTGQTLNRFEAVSQYNGKGEPVGVLYDFSDKWELVPGEWRFQVFDGDRKLIEKKFSVVKAD